MGGAARVKAAQNTELAVQRIFGWVSRICARCTHAQAGAAPSPWTVQAPLGHKMTVPASSTPHLLRVRAPREAPEEALLGALRAKLLPPTRPAERAACAPGAAAQSAAAAASAARPVLAGVATSAGGSGAASAQRAPRAAAAARGAAPRRRGPPSARGEARRGARRGSGCHGRCFGAAAARAMAAGGGCTRRNLTRRQLPRALCKASCEKVKKNKKNFAIGARAAAAACCGTAQQALPGQPPLHDPVPHPTPPPSSFRCLTAFPGGAGGVEGRVFFGLHILMLISTTARARVALPTRGVARALEARGGLCTCAAVPRGARVSPAWRQQGATL